MKNDLKLNNDIDLSTNNLILFNLTFFHYFIKIIYKFQFVVSSNILKIEMVISSNNL
jgi:hypothetical protein